MPIPSVGDKMIDLSLFDLDGKEYKLSDFQDKTILLCFWSTTCLICMKSLPELRLAHEKYKGNLNMISINMDNNRSTWEQGSERDAVQWANLSDGKGAYDGVGGAYGVAAHPAYVLINTNGIIVDRWMGYKQGRFEEKLKQFLS